MSIQKNYDAIIIGAGASGLMCSATAGYQGLNTLVLDHAPKAAAKIRISGGGKCNFTNQTVLAEHFYSQNPHFVKSALSRYQPQDFIELVERHGLAFEQRLLGKLFCQNRASDLIQILRTECDWAGVNFQLNTAITSITYENNIYFVKTDVGSFQTSKLIIATGALSFPRLKATAFGYQIAQQFGLKVLPTRPGLVPLVFAHKWLQFCQHLSGLSLDVSICVQHHCFEEAMLFTHQGISGPAVLQISNVWQKGIPLQINLLPSINIEAELRQLKHAAQPIHTWLNQFWPKKFTQAWLTLHPLEDLANQSDENLKNYAHQLSHWALYPSDTAGYDKAEVTLGGVDTEEVSSKTFESHRQPGLYFIGEVLDVTGQLGGYNFQWAWASGVACGLSLS
jgi:predicted Rossmann fold flavoprotein